MGLNRKLKGASFLKYHYPIPIHFYWWQLLGRLEMTCVFLLSFLLPDCLLLVRLI